MRKRFSPRFFAKPTLIVAQELLGKFLVRRFPRRSALGPRGSACREATAMITEVEAYVGPKDKASHASRGRTERTKVMFGKPGRWYIYMVYGMHYCLNIVTEKEDYPAAVLIRSVENIKGPGKVCRHFRIDKKFNNLPANKKTGLWIEDRGVNPALEILNLPAISRHSGKTAKINRVSLKHALLSLVALQPENFKGGVKIIPRRIRRGKRVGVDYAGDWKEKLWRFYLD